MSRNVLLGRICLCGALLFVVSCSDQTVQPEFVPEQGQEFNTFESSDALMTSFKSQAGDTAFFDFDRSDLNENAIATLNAQIEWIRRNQIKSITVEGHCDERGTREYNLGLGQRRADAVANYLRDGLPGVEINVISYGKDKPIDVVNAVSIDEVYRQNRVAIVKVG